MKNTITISDPAIDGICLLFTVYDSVEEAVKDLKLDRRFKWYEFMGSLIRDIKYKAPCWDCEGSGCHTCGYQKHIWQYYPEYVIDNQNGNPVKINLPDIKF